MVRYRFAYDGKTTVSIKDFVGKPRELYPRFVCIGCKSELIARTKEGKREPHFAHKEIGERQCSFESYLHRLAKERLFDRLVHSKSSGNPVNIEIAQNIACKKYAHILKHDCTVGGALARFNLLQYYDTIEIEKLFTEFRPDILLTDSRGEYPPVFLEIAVTHFCEQDKIDSGYRTIEIPISTEDDVEFLSECDFNGGNSTFHNFQLPSKVAVDRDCSCARQFYFCLIYYRSNKSYLKYATLADISDEITKRKDNIAGYFL